MRIACLVTVLLTILVSTGRAEMRTWVDDTGAYTVAAEMVKADGNSVTLRKSDGGVITVPLPRLSEEDRLYVLGQGQPVADPHAAGKPQSGDVTGAMRQSPVPRLLGYFQHVAGSDDGSSRLVVGIVMTLTAESLHPSEDEFQILIKEARKNSVDQNRLPASRKHILIFDPADYVLGYADGTRSACETFIIPDANKPDGYRRHPVRATMNTVDPVDSESQFSFCVAALSTNETSGKQLVSLIFKDQVIPVPRKSLTPRDIPAPPAAIRPIDIPAIHIPSIPSIPKIHVPAVPNVNPPSGF